MYKLGTYIFKALRELGKRRPFISGGVQLITRLLLTHISDRYYHPILVRLRTY